MTYFSASAAGIEDELNGSGDSDGRGPEEGFSKAKYVAELRSDIAKLDPRDDSHFRLIIELIQNPLIGVKADEWAMLLCVSPMTIHRWKKGGHLPYPIPRKGFVAEILNRLDESASD